MFLHTSYNLHHIVLRIGIKTHSIQPKCIFWTPKCRQTCTAWVSFRL